MDWNIERIDNNPLPGWGKGGGTQYDMMGKRMGVFSNEREIDERYV